MNNMKQLSPLNLQMILTAGFLSLTLTGCGIIGSSPTSPSPAQPGAGMDATQARTEHLDLMAKIEAMTPGNWKKTERPVGDTCRFPDGTAGTQFSDSSSREALPSDNADDLQAQVKALFESKEFRVEQSQDPGTDVTVLRTVSFGPDNLTIGFGSSPFALTLGGTSRCGVDPAGTYR